MMPRGNTLHSVLVFASKSGRGSNATSDISKTSARKKDMISYKERQRLLKYVNRRERSLAYISVNINHATMTPSVLCAGLALRSHFTEYWKIGVSCIDWEKSLGVVYLGEILGRVLRLVDSTVDIVCLRNVLLIVSALVNITIEIVCFHSLLFVVSTLVNFAVDIICLYMIAFGILRVLDSILSSIG